MSSIDFQVFRIGALDTFFIDKLLKGWKPNQFVEGEIRNIIRDDT